MAQQNWVGKIGTQRADASTEFQSTESKITEEGRFPKVNNCFKSKPRANACHLWYLSCLFFNFTDNILYEDIPNIFIFWYFISKSECKTCEQPTTMNVRNELMKSCVILLYI